MKNGQNLCESLANLMKATDGRDGCEDDSEVFERVENAREMLRKTAKNNASTKKKTLVVSHNVTLGLLLASGCK